MASMVSQATPGPAVSDPGPRDPAVRLTRMLDPGSAAALHDRDASGVQVVRGRIGGAEVVAYCTDATTMGGALGAAGCQRIVSAIDTAARRQCPVIGLWHSGGARLADGVDALEGVGSVFARMVRASGKVPQISVVLGPAAGGAAYGPALTDLVVMAPSGRVFVTGPDVVRKVTGEQVDMEGLGGVEAHARKSGVAHVVAGGEQDAYDRVRRITGLFSRPGVIDLDAVRSGPDLLELFPEAANRAYDVRPVVGHLVDRDGDGAGFEELQAAWAPNLVVGLGRLGGRTVGVVANNPIRKAGCLDSLSAEKAARFVRMCDSFGVPLLVLVDVTGYLPGVDQERGGVVRRGAKLLHAFAECEVPRITLITRKAYGGAYIAMNSRALGATAVFAWPRAEVEVMGAAAAVDILHRRQLAAACDQDRDRLHATLVEEHRRRGGLDRAVAIGAVDAVIEPDRTRQRLAEALAAAPPGRGRHGNIPL
jgi:acetyl-CoA/propionyl-CoA carboxylase carboxyl transferase subunit